MALLPFVKYYDNKVVSKLMAWCTLYK